MFIHRRQFLKYCIGSAAAMGLPLTVLGKLEHALAAGEGVLPKVIWLNGANCSGCTVSLANLFSQDGPTDIADLLFNTIDLAFHPTLMAASGDLAVQQLNDTAQGSYILAVDGGIPTAFGGTTCIVWTDNGKEVTALEAVESLAPNATAILGIGTCASSGGVPAANPNVTGIVPVSEIAGSRTINIPGCPTHPDWIVWTVAHLLAGEVPQLDEQSRPSALYKSVIHQNCPRNGYQEATTFGVEGQCLKALGCKGPETKSDCPSRKWNNGTNWCIGAGAICVGCAERDFPDKFSPFYKIEYSYKQFDKSATDNPNSGENPPEQTDGSLVFTMAVWDAGKNRVKVKGKGIAGQIVIISNADSGLQLGAVSVDSSGKWRYYQKNPPSIPNRLLAFSNGQTVSYDVFNIPVREEDHSKRKKSKWRTEKKDHDRKTDREEENDRDGWDKNAKRTRWRN